jgi:hypothetical protein
MLNVSKLNDIIPEVIEADPYIPIKIKWGKWNELEESTVYWRTGDFKKSLFEIGIASETGLIRSITVVTADKIFFDTKKFILSENTKDATPSFNIDYWKQNGRLDEDGLLEIHCNDGGINIVLSTNTIANTIVSGKVSFGLDSNSNLCTIGVIQPSQEEMLQIKDTLEYMSSQNN